MALDAGNYSNGKSAMTMLRSKNKDTRTGHTSFMSKVSSMSFAFTERFEAHIRFPATLDKTGNTNILQGIGDGGAQHLRTNADASLEAAILCEEVQIPGMTLANKELQLGNWTFYRNTNMGFLGNEINITFYSDADWNLRYVFERWMAHCIDPTSKQVRYADEQHGTILINQLDKQDRICGQWELMECTPKVLNLVPLSMGSVSIARTTLIVSSGYWKSRAIDVDLGPVDPKALVD
tara:strand:+ start:605 stop:1312 length:708 start_codon:yes stop_codon:yes gene_type:complete